MEFMSAVSSNLNRKKCIILDETNATRLTVIYELVLSSCLKLSPSISDIRSRMINFSMLVAQKRLNSSLSIDPPSVLLAI